MSISKMFTPPKSKSPWEAMTQGSTGGWAKGIEGWGPALTAAAGMIPYVGPLVSAGMGAAGMAGGKTGFRGTDYGAANWGTTMLGAGLGFGEGLIGKGIGQGVGQMMAGPGVSAGTGSMLGGTVGTTAAPANLFAQGFASGVAGGMGGTAAGSLTPFAGTMLGSSIGAGGGAGKVAGATAGGGAVGGGAATTSALTNPMTYLGLGTMALGQMPTTPTPPNIGDVASKWLTTDAITKAGKLASEIGETEYLGEFDVDKETQAFIQVSGKEIEKAYKTRREQLDQMGQAANPTWLNSGERLEMHRRLNEEEIQETNKMSSQWLFAAKQIYAQNKYNYVMDRIKVDDSVKQDLLYADLADVMWKYNIDRDSVLDFRTLARDAGLYMFQQGVGGSI